MPDTSCLKKLCLERKASSFKQDESEDFNMPSKQTTVYLCRFRVFTAAANRSTTVNDSDHVRIANVSHKIKQLTVAMVRVECLESISANFIVSLITYTLHLEKYPFCVDLFMSVVNKSMRALQSKDITINRNMICFKSNSILSVFLSF